jgi:hypothetical protein
MTTRQIGSLKSFITIGMTIGYSRLKELKG